MTLLAAMALVPAAFAATTRSVPSQYSTIQAAVNACAIGDRIMIADGTYNEQVTVPLGLYGLRISGGSQAGCILQAGANQSALTIKGSDLYIEYMTIKNTYMSGSTTSHAVYATGHHIAFDHCNIVGFQDTFQEYSTVNCYKCEISGEVDFIYGGAASYFDTCTIKQVNATGGYLFAPNTAQTQRGYVCSNCTLTRASGVANDSTYLMRPWGAYGETAFINCSMDSHIKAVGWSDWNGNAATCRAAEYGSKTLAGAAISMTPRASWCVRLTSTSNYTQAVVLGGWVPGVGSWVPYYKLVNRKTGLYVDGMSRATNGSNCGQYSGNGGASQQWAIETAGTYVKLRNRGTALYMDGMGRTGNGSATGQYWGSTSYNQQYTQVSSGGYSTFQNRSSGLMVDGMSLTANSSDLGQYASNGNTSQQFTVAP
jgi:Pectinesterase/Ricin-type beta-trefoil lectin domain-like